MLLQGNFNAFLHYHLDDHVAFDPYEFPLLMWCLGFISYVFLFLIGTDFSKAFQTKDFSFVGSCYGDKINIIMKPQDMIM